MNTCAQCGVEKPTAEFSKDRRSGDGLRWRCKTCDAAYRAADPEKFRARARAAYAADPEKHRTWSAAAYAVEPEKRRARVCVYRKANPDKINAKMARRRATKLRATPGWANSRAIGLWYAGAKTMTQLAGSPYHVDHIVPLRSKLVCGLHVEHNMQLLTQAENSSKHNRHWPEMP